MISPFIGVVTELESYTKAKAMVIVQESKVLRYGALVLIDDEDKKYLAMVTDVVEKNILPMLDNRNLRSLISKLLTIKETDYESAMDLLNVLFSPNQTFIRHYGIRELRLNILGEVITEEGRLTIPSRPPRSSAKVKEPEPSFLQKVIAGGKGFDELLVIGELAYNPNVYAVLDPKKLNMHTAIVGQTGSGKTETVKRLVFEYASKKEKFSNKGGLIVVDVAGEYTGYPYSPSGTVSLLRAALSPSEYCRCEAKWLTATKKTIIVPFDLGSMKMSKADERDFARVIANFTDIINSKYKPKESFEAVIYGRHSVYLYSNNNLYETRNPIDVLDKIKNIQNLVIAMPLPSSLDINTITELARTKSEIFPDLVETIANILGTHEGDYIDEIPALNIIVSALMDEYVLKGANNQKNQKIVITLNDLEKLIKEVGNVVTKGSNCEKQLDLTIWKVLGYPGNTFAFKSLLLKTAYDFILEKGASTSLPENPFARPCDVLKQAYSAGFEGYMTTNLITINKIVNQQQQQQTKRSLRRGLDSVARRISPFLNRIQYKEIVLRSMEGFTIVHLAPPSRGSNEYSVARLIDETFNVAVEEFDENRRILVVIEEAHNLAPSNGKKSTNRSLLRVAREGRKWGLGLVLVSQRPGFVDSDILSQASTLIALRMTNPTDIMGLKKGVEAVSQELLDRLPDLDQGQAVIAGIATPERRIPLLVKIQRIG